MSMLSAQADELRELALWLDDEFYDEYATRARDAADTILSLRDKAQELQAENSKLRELLLDYDNMVVRLQSVVSDGADNARELRAENAKLRDACAELLRMAERHDHEWLHWPEMHDELRKLGVEV